VQDDAKIMFIAKQASRRAEPLPGHEDWQVFSLIHSGAIIMQQLNFGKLCFLKKNLLAI
jgi:hypothetical protein